MPGPVATANDGFKIVDSYAVKLGKNLVSLSITFAANNDKKAGTTGLNPFSLSGAYMPKCGTLVGNDAVCGHITSGGNAWITQIADIKEGVSTTVETPAYICF